MLALNHGSRPAGLMLLFLSPATLINPQCGITFRRPANPLFLTESWWCSAIPWRPGHQALEGGTWAPAS